MILKIPLSCNLNVDPSKRNVSLSMHDRNFLRDRVSSTCEPGLRHTGGWLALLGSSRLPARSHSNFSIGVTSLLCIVHAVPIRLRMHTMQQSLAAPPCCIMSSRIIGACTISCVVLPRVQPCATTATQVNLCCYVLSGFHLFLKRVVRGRRLSAQSRWFRLFRWYFLFFKSRRDTWILTVSCFFLNFFPRL